MDAGAFKEDVSLRAANRCEYCRMHQSLQGATFHIEHVVPRSQGGPTSLDNLAWACPACNLHKSDRTQVLDELTGTLVPLFHPRLDRWSEHFEWSDYQMVPRTAIGRATIDALHLNHERRLQIRKAEELFDLFPPPREEGEG